MGRVIATWTLLLVLAGCDKPGEPNAAPAGKQTPAVTAQAIQEPASTAPPSVQATQAQTSIKNGIPVKEVAICAGEVNTVKRLACFDEVATRHGQAPTSVSTSEGSKGEWRTSTDTDPLTDKSVHFAMLTASEGQGRYGDKIVLVVRCKSGRTDAFVNWQTFLGSDSILVTSRIEKEKAVSSSWSLSTDHKASFMPNPPATLKKFEGASTYVVNLTPYSESPITAIFELQGANEALADIRKDCKW